LNPLVDGEEPQITLEYAGVKVIVGGPAAILLKGS
jgi:hypothetical protein